MGVLTAGAIGRASELDTLELRYRCGQPGATVTLQAGRTYRTRTVTFASGVRLVLPAGCVVELVDNGTLASTYLYVPAGVESVTIDGEGAIRGTSSVRTAVYGLVRCVDAVGVTIDGIDFSDSPSAALWTSGGSDITLRNFSVADMGADGLHFSRGTTGILVEDGTIARTGDDGIAAWSETAYSQISDVTWRRLTIDDVAVGRGAAIIGVNTFTLADLTISNVDQSGISIHNGTSVYAPANGTITGCTVNMIGRNVPVGGTDDGIYIEDLATGSVTNNHVDGAPGYGLLVATSTNVTRSGNTYANCIEGNESPS